MTTFAKAAGSLGLFALALILLDWLVFEVPARKAEHRILSSDHGAILAACRNMMDHAAMSTNSDTYLGTTTFYKDTEQFTLRVPTAIAQLSPYYVSASTNSVLICFYGPPHRVYVRAFPLGTDTYKGRKKLIAGLWLN